MPRRDGTGPQGRGPMTGWGLGFCREIFRNKFSTPKQQPIKEDEKNNLKVEIDNLKDKIKKLEEKLFSL